MLTYYRRQPVVSTAPQLHLFACVVIAPVHSGLFQSMRTVHTVHPHQTILGNPFPTHNKIRKTCRSVTRCTFGFQPSIATQLMSAAGSTLLFRLATGRTSIEYAGHNVEWTCCRVVPLGKFCAALVEQYRCVSKLWRLPAAPHRSQISNVSAAMSTPECLVKQEVLWS